MQIIIFGAPGVGKGTQAKILASKLNLAHISTGDILREAIKNETELGLKAKEIVQSGGLVPDEIVGGIVKETLQQERCKNGFILDGFPRTLPQAEILTRILSELNNEKLYLIKLEADDDVIVSRLSNRLVCSKCGYIINKDALKDNAKCPSCGAENSFVKRKDDEEDVIKNRLKVYHETTEPVFEYYKDKAEIIEVDGTKSIEEVSRAILNKLNSN
jgi:adenylate kinase